MAYYNCTFLLVWLNYTTDPHECLPSNGRAATECSPSESDLDSPVESHKVAKQWPSTPVERSVSTWWDSIDHSKSLSFCGCSAIARRALVGISGVVHKDPSIRGDRWTLPNVLSPCHVVDKMYEGVSSGNWLASQGFWGIALLKVIESSWWLYFKQYPISHAIHTIDNATIPQYPPKPRPEC